jgi:hypothetical protein
MDDNDDKKFRKLDDDFKDAIEGSSPEEIKKRIVDLAIYEVEKKEELKADPDVAQTKQAYADATEDFRTELKETRLKIEWCKRMLERKGAA